MITWSIDVALNTNCFDKVIVSTDSEEIAEISKKSGAVVNELRPQRLADDYTGTSEVIRYEIKELDYELCERDVICELYPTTPLLKPSTLEQRH